MFGYRPDKCNNRGIEFLKDRTCFLASGEILIYWHGCRLLMPEGNGPIILGMLLALAGIATSYLRLYTRDERLIQWSRWITIGLFMVVTGAMLFLYYLFITTDVSYGYVWQYTKADAPMKYRVSGTIAGIAGSLLFWIWMITIPWVIEELRSTRRSIDPDVMDWTRIAVFATITLFLYNLSIHGLFSPTEPSLLATAPEGLGLNLLLQTDLMVIHPPVVFVAYGFLVIPFAAAFGHLLSGNKDWLKLSIPWSRAGWLFLTAGIGIGGLWAYEVLGWGGYWGWDPVETASLLPWLLLTGFLHAQLMNKRKGDYPILAPLLGVFSFVLIVFATFATRAGGLWISVHTFDSANQTISVWERFKDVLESNPSIRVYLLFMVVTIVLAIWLVMRLRSMRPKKEEDRYISLEELIDDDFLMFGTVVIFILTTLVTFFILLGGTKGQLTADNFNTPLGLLALVGTLMLLVCLVWRDLGRKRVAQIAGVALIAAIVGGFLFSDNAGVAASLPILAVGLVGTIYTVGKSFNRRRVLPSLRPVAAHLIHLSVILILIGYVGSTFLKEETTIDMTEGGGSSEFGGYDFRVTNLDSGADFVYIDVEVSRNGNLISKERPGVRVIQSPFGQQQQRSEVKVVKLLGEDVYLTYNGTDMVGSERIIHLDVTTLPLMNVLWAGMYLMMFGIALRMGIEVLAKRGRSSRTGATDMQDEEPEVEEEEEEPSDEPKDEGDLLDEEDPGMETEEESLDDSYYEDLLEEELKRI